MSNVENKNNSEGVDPVDADENNTPKNPDGDELVSRSELLKAIKKRDSLKQSLSEREVKIMELEAQLTETTRKKQVEEKDIEGLRKSFEKELENARQAIEAERVEKLQLQERFNRAVVDRTVLSLGQEVLPGKYAELFLELNRNKLEPVFDEDTGKETVRVKDSVLSVQEAMKKFAQEYGLEPSTIKKGSGTRQVSGDGSSFIDLASLPTDKASLVELLRKDPSLAQRISEAAGNK